MSINRVNITGNLTRDPELRSTAGGMAVLGFGVAVNDRRKNQQTGQFEDYPNFVDCTMFGNRAEALSRILRKGMKVAIEGKLRYSSWEDKNGGGRRSKLEVIPDEVELLSQNPNAQQGQPQQYAPHQNGMSSSYTSSCCWAGAGCWGAGCCGACWGRCGTACGACW